MGAEGRQGEPGGQAERRRRDGPSSSGTRSPPKVSAEEENRAGIPSAALGQVLPGPGTAPLPGERERSAAFVGTAGHIPPAARCELPARFCCRCV